MSRLHFDVLTLFPEMFPAALSCGVFSGACKKEILSYQMIDPRFFTQDIHQSVDDRPFGGGDGMVMLFEPLSKAMDMVLSAPKFLKKKRRVIYLSPQGDQLCQSKVEYLSCFEHLVLICGRYDGVDQRFLNEYVDEELSIGPYITTGGELPALVVMDAVSRFVPGVLHNSESNQNESFTDGYLEAPLFTRPRLLDQGVVPDVLLSGNHEKIKKWKRMLSILVTLQKRPDLISKDKMNSKEVSEAFVFFHHLSEDEKQICGLSLHLDLHNTSKG